MDPRRIPGGRDHLDGNDRARLETAVTRIEADDLESAKDLVEELWAEAADAHRGLYQGLANALTAVVAHRAGHHRGAAEVAARTRQLLAGYPRPALGLDLDLLLATMDGVLAGTAEVLRIQE